MRSLSNWIVDRSWLILADYRIRFSCPLSYANREDAGKYLLYYQENLEYLRPSGGYFVIDEDVKELGLSNRKVELLERCVVLLEKGETAELALRVLRRYTAQTFTQAAEWRAWLDANKSKLFFTDTSGYLFFAAPGK